VKFGTVEGNKGPTAVPYFILIRQYLGVFGKKNAKIAKNANFCPFLPDVGEIHRVYADNRSTEVVNIWCSSVGKLGIYRQKTRSSETTGPIEKYQGNAKMVQTPSTFMQSLMEIHDCVAV